MMMYAFPLPEGCREDVRKDKNGLGFRVTVFPCGAELDSELAPFWCYYLENWQDYMPKQDEPLS
jgi:hypothetical protein